MASGRCTQTGCDAATTGVCIDKLPLNECPNFKFPDAPAVAEEPTGAAKEPPSEDWVLVGGGINLSSAKADEFVRGTPTRMVALVGGPEVGKTTLIAMLYELARRRMLERFRFLGSETLRALEERCHLSRTASGNIKPDTPHSSRKTPLAFLHLKLADQRGGRGIHLLMSDRTGEDFDDVLNEPEKIKAIAEVHRCENLALLVDGELLAHPDRCNDHISRVRRTFMILKQFGAIVPGKNVQVVITKGDLLANSPFRNEATRRLEELGKELVARAQPLVEPKFVRTAARPSPSTPLGLGLEELLTTWLEPATQKGFNSPVPVLAAACSSDPLMVRFAE
jgi:hypothetical protein